MKKATRKEKDMELYDVLMAIDNNTKIRLTITMYGMKFSTEHYAEYLLNCDEADNFLGRIVTNMRVVEENTLEIVLKSE